MTMYPTDRLIAAPRGSVEEAVAFFRRMGSARFEHVEMYVRTVYDIAPKVGLDPAIMVAHASHETNYFRSYWWIARLNPAGIGITGVYEQNIRSKYFADGRDAARAHMAHMLLYATGKISAPLTNADDPRYDAYVNSYGLVKKADTIQDLTMTWAWDKNFHIGVARQGNEIFPNLPNSKPIEQPKPQGPVPSKIMYQGRAWTGEYSIRVNGILFRALRRTVTVNVSSLNVRRYASTTSDILRSAQYGENIAVIGWTTGERVGTENRWWISRDHERIWVGGTSQKP